MTDGILDREKVMRGLEKCTGASSDCEGCPYADENGISCSSIMNIMRDAYALLKEREPVKPYHLHNAYFSTNITNLRFEHQCTNCSSYLLPNWKACTLCGKGLKWDD